MIPASKFLIRHQRQNCFVWASLTLLATLPTAQAQTTDSLVVTDAENNLLLQVNDEGPAGSLTLPDLPAAPTSATNKLYNLGGALHFNGAALGPGAGSSPWTDPGTHVFYNGGVLATGSVDLNTDGSTIPATGPGTRLMWYPAKGAFRAGRVIDSKWNAPNVGFYSFAQGYNTRASGEGAAAFGLSTTASGTSAVALGDGATASGNFSFAAGTGTTAATDGSVSLGKYNDANRTKDGTAFVVGNGSFNTRSDALVVTQAGVLTVADSVKSLSGGFVLPDGTTLATQADLGGDSPWEVQGTYIEYPGGLVATGLFGGGALPAQGAGARMMWYDGKAAFRAGRVEGDHWNANRIGNYSTAFGLSSVANGDGSFAAGRYATAYGSAAIALGDGTVAAEDGSVVLGRYNLAGAGFDGTVLVVGNGTAENRSDALVLRNGGQLTVAGSVRVSSDARLKTAVSSIPPKEALALIERLRAVRYRFRPETNRSQEEQIGLIAQEVQTVLPELVSEGTDGMLSVNYAQLTAVLAGALQAQQAKNDALQAQVNRLHARFADLEALLVSDARKAPSAEEVRSINEPTPDPHH